MYLFFIARCVFHVHIITRYMYDARRREFGIISKFCVENVLMSVR